MSNVIVGDSYDLLLKMVVIGDTGVGKTNLLGRFQKNQFSGQSKPTIGVQFATKTVSVENHKIKVQIWDTAGQQRFRAITHAYYKGASGALIVFDLTRRSTYQNISKWLKQLKQNAQENIVCILIGNKSDLTQNRSVKASQIQQFAQQNKLAYLQTSAKQGVNVLQAFYTVIQEIYHIKNKNSLLTCSNTTDKVNKGKSSSNSSTNKIPNEKAVLKKDNNKNIVLDLQKDGKSQKKKGCC